MVVTPWKGMSATKSWGIFQALQKFSHLTYQPSLFWTMSRSSASWPTRPLVSFLNKKPKMLTQRLTLSGPGTKWRTPVTVSTISSTSKLPWISTVKMSEFSLWFSIWVDFNCVCKYLSWNKIQKNKPLKWPALFHKYCLDIFMKQPPRGEGWKHPCVSYKYIWVAKAGHIFFFNVNIIHYIHYDIEFLIRMYSISKYREGRGGCIIFVKWRFSYFSSVMVRLNLTGQNYVISR